jgi:signal transduction histidine kinase
MSTLKKITIGIPSQLFHLGLTEAQIHGVTHRWLVIFLFQQGKITSTEAGALLSTDRDGFLSMLDKLGVLYEDVPEDKNLPTRASPKLVELAKAHQQVDVLRQEEARAKYQLFQVKKQLEQADRVRSDFIATVSHELRTPLNSIIGFAKLLLNQRVGPLNQIQQTDLALIYDSAKHLLSLVNNILDLSKIEAGKIRLDMDWISVEEIIVGVIASTYILIEGNPVELREEIEPGLPRIYVDRERIRQVVINLLSNAAKFTHAGAISLRIYKIIEKEQEFVCFAVKDTGIGISKEDMTKIFEPFRQVDNATSRRAEGTGLGLPISQRLVQLHGGRIWVESKIGQGSTFYFIIPVKPQHVPTSGLIHAEYRLS